MKISTLLKRVSLVLFIVLSTSCFSSPWGEEDNTGRTHDMKCKKIRAAYTPMKRCENSEVICYIAEIGLTNGVSISCKFKENK